ncbi:MAG: YcgN family cysteine cluster protein [Deltaproteobacteria bacterium]|nr:YcgN family cysteine cluster protein [Deltaproteobacteria bacterium]
MINHKKEFWKTKSMEEMTARQWESLCDGCGRCCLEKLEDEDTGEVFYTSVACRFLDIGACRCSVYEKRAALAPECLFLTSEKARAIDWLPVTCAYRLLAEGKDLKWWHPLVSGNPDTVHQAGISVRDKIISARHADPNHLEAYIIDGLI